ncbi:MAG: anaerobic ribonucleoside-triphosphate reductase [Nitrososphaera sp.]
MEQVAYDYSSQQQGAPSGFPQPRDGEAPTAPPSRGRGGSVLESASKRVRMIFSVMASPNRIDILRILNTKGPLTYSELKALAGFKSKKESGKFAYHLRKLLRQMLIGLNKAERRYTITNLGKLVLSLARQIEERSIIEGGKMYVRTSRHSIEEFNSHKIVQSLVREANLPLEQAQKITEEVENKIYKFQTSYLTSSLIRETVNSVLIEHGHEEYRNKLARLGLPPSEIVDMLSGDSARNGIDGLYARAAGSVFSEYLVFDTLPKDIADLHLGGDINISSPGTWSLVPDTVFLDISDFEDGLDLKGKFLGISRLPAFKTSDDILAALPVLAMLLSREASSEVVLSGVLSLVLKNTRDADEIASRFARALVACSASPSWQGAAPLFTIAASLEDHDAKHINAILDGYRKYADSTPVPRICLSLSHKGKLKDSVEHLASAVRSGGLVSFSYGDGAPRSSTGTKLIGKRPPALSLHGLSLNLPRLAYDSNRDETYFRARLALAIKPAISALAMRSKGIAGHVKKSLLPTIAACTGSLERGTSSIVINLTGGRESVYDILGHSGQNGADVLHKVLRTAAEVASAAARREGEESAGIAMVSDDSSARFASLDSDKFGKVSLAQHGTYSQGLVLAGKDVLADKGSLLRDCASTDRLLGGGFTVTLDVTEMSLAEIRNSIDAVTSPAAELPFIRPRSRTVLCSSCGRRSKASLERCEACKSPHRFTTSF